jgi:hypothetical protein
MQYSFGPPTVGRSGDVKVLTILFLSRQLNVPRVVPGFQTARGVQAGDPSDAGPYRLIAAIHFNRQIVYVMHVLTHDEYDQGTWKIK